MQPVQALRTEDPERIGDFTVLGRLGRGAMGTVYLARSAGGRRVAVKVARPELAEDARFRERFRNEVAMARAVGGFWTAAVVDADPDAPRPWLATEFVPGPTLHDVVAAHGPMPEPELRRLVAGLAEALLAIHATGLVHRDLKPSNVLLGADGPRVIDFGIAKALETTGLTATGMLIGTPGYLSPEQIAGGPVTAASDVFALGSVLVYAATGAGPFGTGDAAALMYRVVNGEPRLDGVPPSLAPLTSRCLSRDPAARPSPDAILKDVNHRDLQPTALLQDPNATYHRDPTQAYPAPPIPVDGNRAVFKTSRLAAFVGGGAALAAALTCSSIAGAASRTGQDGMALLWFVGFVLLMIPAVRLLWSAVRSRRTLELSADGMAIGVGTRKRRLGWPQIGRVRVVETRSRPWLVIWLTDQNDSLGGLAGPYRGEHGGYRVFPVGHERRKKARLHEVRELRAALAWYARGLYDWSP